MLFSGLYSTENGYYIYKFFMNKNDNISLSSSKYIDSKLKISDFKKHTHDALVYKIKNSENTILFEGEISNPKLIHSEYLLNQNPSKNKVFLDDAYFVVKVPVFLDIDKIEFYKNHTNEQVTQIKLNNINHT